MEKDNNIDETTARYLKDILVAKKVSIKDFEEKAPNLKFDEDTKTVWDFVIIKSFDINYSYLMPLAHHLIDHNYCSVDSNMAQYAALTGYQLEQGLNNIKKVQDTVNETMADFRFEEKMVITNEPAENIYNLAKKIISRTADSEYNKVKEVLEKAGVDTSTVKLMNRPEKKVSLKM